VLHIKEPAIIRQKTKKLVMSFRWEPDTKTGKLTSTSTAGSKSEAVNVF
jgi:hypothetical protein